MANPKKKNISVSVCWFLVTVISKTGGASA